MYRFFFKRVLDFIGALFLIILLSPIMLITSLLVLLKHGSPILFSQRRLGYKNRVFRVYKFRSMNNLKDEDGALLPDKERLTKFGAWLRKTSLDELPQIFNVLKGDMSFIGPRPLFVRYKDYYTSRESLRHQVKPGITGWAQVKGRNTLKWDTRLEYDVYYYENISLFFDLKIFILTLIKIIKSEGVNIIPGNNLEPLDKVRIK